MVFWQLAIDANDPALRARFWTRALGYQPAPPSEPDTTWHTHYRSRFGEQTGFDDRLFDPAGLRPPIWFRQVPEPKAGKNRLHLDLYPTGRDDALPMQQRIEIVEAKVAELIDLGASVQRRTRYDDRRTRATSSSCTIRKATNSALAEIRDGRTPRLGEPPATPESPKPSALARTEMAGVPPPTPSVTAGSCH